MRLGRQGARGLYGGMLAAAFVTAPFPWLFGGDGLDAWLLLPWLAIPLALPVAKIVRERTDGPSLNGALAKTGMLQLVFCTLLSIGLLAS